MGGGVNNFFFYCQVLYYFFYIPNTYIICYSIHVLYFASVGIIWSNRGIVVGRRAANRKVGSLNPTWTRSVSLGKKLNSIDCVDRVLFQCSPMDGSAPNYIKKRRGTSVLFRVYKDITGLSKRVGKPRVNDSLICHVSSS